MARRRYGREEPEDRRDDPPADPVEVAREIVLRQLTARARTRAELEQALDKRGVPQDAAAEVLDRFTELGLVDDAEYARLWVSGQQRRQRGRRVLAQELRRKGVDADVVADAVGALPSDGDRDAARALARKKVATMTGLEPQVRYRRLAGALARRGFGGDVVHEVLREVLDEVGDE